MDAERKELEIIARIHTPFAQKFGIPRQSGLVDSVTGEIHFTSAYCSIDGVRGIEEFTYLWLLWGFSRAKRKKDSLAVYPPRLGGKEKRGVFATRSPYRPNGIGLSSVRLEQVRTDEAGHPVLLVSGVDLLDGTPIYDIKPYLPYTDAHPEASGGFGEDHRDDRIPVHFPEEQIKRLPAEIRQTVKEILMQDPRAAYNKNPGYVYGLAFGGYDIRFTADGGEITVTDVVETGEEPGRIK